MAPRLIQEDRCPHCDFELPDPKPRVCPACAGSLQVRYLKKGCLTSKPLVLVFGLGLLWALSQV